MPSLPSSRRRRAFTLMEVLLVLVILVILGSMAGVAIQQAQRSANINAAKAQIKMLEGPLDIYQINIQRYPTDLSGLVERPGDLPNPERWEGPYLKPPKLPVDPWGKPYIYETDDSGSTYRIYSVGPDGVQGTADDIHSD